MDDYKNHQDLVDLYNFYTKPKEGKSEFPLPYDLFDVRILEVILKEIFPSSTEVTKEVRYNIGYRSSECNAKHFLMRKCPVGEKVKYIIFFFDLEASGGPEMDLEIFSVDYHFGQEGSDEAETIMRFIDSTIRVVDEDEVDCAELIEEYGLTQFSTVVSLFKELSPRNWERSLIDYARSGQDSPTESPIETATQRVWWYDSIDIIVGWEEYSSRRVFYRVLEEYFTKTGIPKAKVVQLTTRTERESLSPTDTKYRFYAEDEEVGKILRFTLKSGDYYYKNIYTRNLTQAEREAGFVESRLYCD